MKGQRTAGCPRASSGSVWYGYGAFASRVEEPPDHQSRVPGIVTNKFSNITIYGLYPVLIIVLRYADPDTAQWNQYYLVVLSSIRGSTYLQLLDPW